MINRVLEIIIDTVTKFRLLFCDNLIMHITHAQCHLLPVGGRRGSDRMVVAL